MGERLVIVSHSVDEEMIAVDLEVLADHAQVVFLTHLASRKRAELISRAEVLLASRTFSDEVDQYVLSQSTTLGLVQLLSVGIDHLDFSIIPPQAIVASNAGALSVPIAEHVVALTLALAKRLPQRHAALLKGSFDQSQMSKTLSGAVCGIIGFGGIGKATARLMRSFGAHIWAINTTGTTSEYVEFIGTLRDLHLVVKVCDVLVLCLPLKKNVEGLIGARELSLMKPDAILVNVARGAVVQEKALYEHLRAHPEFCAGIDTWWHEPGGDYAFRQDYPFLDLPNIIGSPHNSAMVPGLMRTVTRAAAVNVLSYLTGAPIHGVVHRDDYGRDDE